MSVQEVEDRAELAVENIGGIDETEVTFEPGVTVLSGRNATNRTSLLQAIMAALGSDRVSVKADAEEAAVELTIGGERHVRTLKRGNGSLRTDGDPYLEDPTVADLLAFLLESSETRRAVVTGEDLREIIMRPVDTDEIQTKIDDLLEERRQVTEELDELDDLKSRLPSLEEKRTHLRERMEKTEAELADVEERIKAADADVEQSREERAELEAKLKELSEKRSALEEVRYELETEQESLESLRTEAREVEAEYDSLPEAPGADLEELEGQIGRLRSRKHDLESELDELQSVIGFNQERLSEADGSFDILDEDGPVTDELLAGETVRCWTCGSEVDTGQIESTIETLRERSQEMVGEINGLESELKELKTKRGEREDQQRRRERLQRRRDELDGEIEETEARIEELKSQREALREEIEAAEATVEEREDDAYERILELHKEANQLEYDLGTVETDLERVEENIATIEERLEEEADLEARRREINDDIEELRTRIERVEKEAISAFNDQMETVLELLGYGNLERVWLERTETEVREGRRTVTRSVFDLHVVREMASGTTYEDTVDNLSESEREVTGLVFALAGYLAHEVYETVPFMLLDSLEAIDSERIARLVGHVEEYCPYLVIALLPEDARMLPDEYDRVTEI